jgi:hypothetical protein
MQQLITYTLVAAAVIYLVLKFFKKKKIKGGCDRDCGCN